MYGIQADMSLLLVQTLSMPAKFYSTFLPSVSLVTYAAQFQMRHQSDSVVEGISWCFSNKEKHKKKGREKSDDLLIFGRDRVDKLLILNLTFVLHFPRIGQTMMSG